MEYIISMKQIIKLNLLNPKKEGEVIKVESLEKFAKARISYLNSRESNKIADRKYLSIFNPKEPPRMYHEVYKDKDNQIVLAIKYIK
jgi:hypothetical protein